MAEPPPPGPPVNPSARCGLDRRTWSPTSSPASRRGSSSGWIRARPFRSHRRAGRESRNALQASGGELGHSRAGAGDAEARSRRQEFPVSELREIGRISAGRLGRADDWDPPRGPDSHDFPVFSLPNGISRAETGSHQTAPPAILLGDFAETGDSVDSHLAPYAPIAQLDRASGCGPEGRTFESCWARQGNMKHPGRLRLGCFRLRARLRR